METCEAGADHEALAWLAEQAGPTSAPGSNTGLQLPTGPASTVDVNMGMLVGSYA